MLAQTNQSNEFLADIRDTTINHVFIDFDSTIFLGNLQNKILNEQNFYALLSRNFYNLNKEDQEKAFNSFYLSNYKGDLKGIRDVKGFENFESDSIKIIETSQCIGTKEKWQQLFYALKNQNIKIYIASFSPAWAIDCFFKTVLEINPEQYNIKIIGTPPNNEGKNPIIKTTINEGEYAKALLVDDRMENLKKAVSLGCKKLQADNQASHLDALLIWLSSIQPESEFLQNVSTGNLDYYSGATAPPLAVICSGTQDPDPINSNNFVSNTPHFNQHQQPLHFPSSYSNTSTFSSYGNNNLNSLPQISHPLNNYVSNPSPNFARAIPPSITSQAGTTNNSGNLISGFFRRTLNTVSSHPEGLLYYTGSDKQVPYIIIFTNANQNQAIQDANTLINRIQETKQKHIKQDLNKITVRPYQSNDVNNGKPCVCLTQEQFEHICSSMTYQRFLPKSVIDSFEQQQKLSYTSQPG